LQIKKLQRSLQLGILVLYKTHLSEGQFLDDLKADYITKAEIYHSALEGEAGTRAAGVVIVVNKELGFKATKYHEIEPGRAIMVEVKWCSMNLTAMEVYAPNNPGENRNLWKKIVDVCLQKNLPTPNIIGTDTNLVEEEIDRMPQHKDDTAATEALLDFKQVFNLHNGWRNVNPTMKGYTYQQ
ncbi:hypothetical protein CPB85DRAFT_1180292, partial [Mucidula mucida]